MRRPRGRRSGPAAASAQGIALFGDARLGLGYNIDNDGGILIDEDGTTPDDLRAVSRVRFGVNMTGETDSGITFGAEIRADNAEGGEGDTEGQSEGSVFVSGSFGTLSYGDTNGADEQWVGDVPGDYSLTGLGELDETRFVSNGGDFGADSGTSFASNPVARPTVRYDYRLRRLRPVAVVEPRPDRHRASAPGTRPTSAAEAGRPGSATTSSTRSSRPVKPSRCWSTSMATA